MQHPKIIAHRGGRKWAPENTLAAFDKSLAMGVYGIELDVQRCATGELVVCHDETLQRTTNGAGLLKDHSWSELQKLSAGAWFDPAFTNERLPLLSQVLDLISGKLMINIELKNLPVGYPGIEDDLLKVIAGYKKETLVISSFDQKLMVTLHKKAPELKIAWLGAAVVPDLQAVATAMGATHFHPSLDCLRLDVVQEARAIGLTTNAWTCNTSYDWEMALDMQVDGIITDDPVGLDSYLKQK